MKIARSPVWTFLTLISALSVCLGSFLLIASGFNLQKQARLLFGEPYPDIGQIRKIYLSIALLVQSKDLTQPVDSKENSRIFSIDSGELTNHIIKRLEAEGFIKNANAFQNYLQYKGLDKTLQAGKHELNPTMTAIQIAAELQDATPDQVTFIILPGWRIEEIAASLPTSGLEISPREFLNAAETMPDPYANVFQTTPNASVEGFLLSGVYEIKRDISTKKLIEIWLQNFDDRLTPDVRQGFKKQGITIFQAVILASIVQKEALQPDEMPMIASVFLNRLAIGMKLDSDPTVQYALGFDNNKKTWWKVPLQSSDFENDSPYNTYKNSGLPPGPIANPSLEALSAVAFPAQTSYFYFRSNCSKDGRHVFSKTYQEHIQNACP